MLLVRTRATLLRRAPRRTFTASARAREIYDNATPDALASVIEQSRELGRRVLVDFHAEWCAPCKMLSPTLERVAQSLPDTDLVKIDIDEHVECAQQYRVQAVPTVVIVVDGQRKNTFVGALSESSVRHWVDKAGAPDPLGMGPPRDGA